MSSQHFWNDLEELIHKHRGLGVKAEDIASMLNEKADDMADEEEEEPEEEEEDTEDNKAGEEEEKNK